MKSSLRANWLSIWGSYWFIPSLLTTAAFFLAHWTIHIDRTGGAGWLAAFQWYELSQPDGARVQLSLIASSMMTISSTLFAITIAAVAFASGNYGPRLLANFMNDRGNQISLGVFVATFVYNFIVLRAVGSPEGDADPGGATLEQLNGFVPQLSIFVSTITALLAIAVLIYFLNHIPASIRINTVAGGIGRRLIRDIEERFPLAGGATEPCQRTTGHPVTARSVGYIKIIDFGELDAIARREALTIALSVRTGDFIHPHLPVAETSEEAPEAVQARILHCFSLGESRTPTQDLEFLFDELAEIALRALSPGINDPFTAITCIHWMGAALAKLADRTLTEGPDHTRYDLTRVKPIADDFGHFVRRSFGAVRASAAANPVAGKVFLERLNGVATGATSQERRMILVDEARTFAEQADLALEGPARRELRAQFENLGF